MSDVAGGTPDAPPGPAPLFPPRDLPLKDDVHVLGALLGDVLREQGGEEFYERVERARHLGRRRRDGDATADAELRAEVAGLPPGVASELVRAFSAYFSLVNMAERVHRVRLLRGHQAAGTTPPGSLAAALRALRDDGVSLAGVRSALARLQVVPVVTAHPTEAVRRTLLHKDQRIARALVDRIERAGNPVDDAQGLARIRLEVTTAWQTEEHAPQAPAVSDEVEHLVFYLIEVVYRVIPGFYDALATALHDAYGAGAGAEEELPPALVRFATWVGGDMDGNPNVGAESIRRTLDYQRGLVLRRYRAEVQRLAAALSQSTPRVVVAPAVVDRAAALGELLPAARGELADRYRDMPYRVLLELVAARLTATAHDEAAGYPTAAALREDLALVAQSLRAHGGEHAGYRLVRRLLRRLDTFGFHLATLDVRQHALVHRRAAGALLGDPGFAARPALERLAALAAALDAGAAPVATADPDAARALAVMRAIAAAQSRHGAAAIGPYVVSMAAGPDDVLAVLFLWRAAGLAGDEVPLDVAPLLETTADLGHGRALLRVLLQTPAYRRHLAARGDAQVVMLGYSDSNKEAGFAASRWALYQAQLDLAAVAAGAHVELTLFHGRGGTASRGGSKPREGILAEPPGVMQGRLRVTEQGEIVHAKYGLRGIAVRTLELMTGALLEVTACAGRCRPAQREWAEAMATLAAASRQQYRALCHDDADFLDYFRGATPIDVIERLRIGSRPSRRVAGGGLEELRAIPWVFAWTQNRQLLPSWYGVGTGLERAVERHGFAALAAMAHEWPFFANLLADLEMALGKTDLGVGARYAELAGAAGVRLFPLIRAELERTRELCCAVRGESRILEGEPTLRRALALRDPYLDPMSLVQVDLLERWRAAGRPDDDVLRALFTTVRGIARAMQNTG